MQPAESARNVPPEVSVRPARAAEAGLLVELQLRMARETEGLGLDRPTVERGVRAVFADPALGEYWVAETAGQLLGALLITREWSDWRAATVLWIQSVYVLPEARGQGIYRRLYEHQRRRVELAPDLCGLRLYVDKRNRSAQQVYLRLGMSREHYELFEWMKATTGA
ncbi:MAG: GNAT family N-acetyltransferase [Acidobacteriota bacterium]|nr:GNAT family N-acetyltransferase [Acidobacteriota bacterium]